ncbi:MAG: ATP-binding cassette domain-containing protein [Acholeplasmataceae bacterium]
MSTHYIKLQNIKHYDMKKSYSMDFDKGKTYQLIGENGSGKTTLLKIIAGFIKPNQGICINAAKKISIMPDIHYLPPQMTIYVYLHQLHELFKENIDISLLHVLELPLSKKIDTLSLGQKQKLAILQSFMGNPDVVLLDEPLKTLDAQSKKKVIQYFKNSSSLIIYATHHLTHDQHLVPYYL